MMFRHRNRWIALAALVGLAAVTFAAWTWYSDREPAGDGVFLVKPYLQWGAGTQQDSPGGLEVLWQGADRDESWSLEVRAEADPNSDSDSKHPWVEVGPLKSRRVAIDGVAPRRLYRAVVPGGTPGCTFGYRVRRGGVPVFEARGRIPWTEEHPHRFVVFGDCGADTSGQRTVAYQTALARPDFVFITGDLVYYKGSFSEYLRHFFPIYNSDQASPRTGAPLLRSTLIVAAAGNHDLIERDLDRCPDGLAFYLLWSLPLNGPIGTPGAANTPALMGKAERQRAFLDLAGPAYPRMANYSFDYGGAHWAVLDTNPYADWTDPELRAWLRRPQLRRRTQGSLACCRVPPAPVPVGEGACRRAADPRPGRSLREIRRGPRHLRAHPQLPALLPTPVRRRQGRRPSPPMDTSPADGRSTPPTTVSPGPAPTASSTSSRVPAAQSSTAASSTTTPGPGRTSPPSSSRTPTR